MPPEPPEPPAAPPDAAASPMAAAAEEEEAHDQAQKRPKMHEGAEQGTLQAMHLTSSNLESSQVQNATTPSDDGGASSPLLQHDSHDAVESQNQAGVGVAIEVHEPTTISDCAMNEAYIPDPGKTPPATSWNTLQWRLQTIQTIQTIQEPKMLILP
jgi:hypothetical protein